MKTRHLLPLVLAAAACGPDNPQNSAFCGITMIASANRVLDGLANVHALLSEPPDELRSGPVPVRVVGYGAGEGLVAEADSGRVALGFEGEGFPELPGFAIALVDDSSEVFRGVLVLDPEPPQGYPQIGTVSSGNATVPLYGLRIHWSSVNSEECPLFPADTAEQ